MKAQFGETKEINMSYGSPPPGNYALEPIPSKSIHWDHCREQFAPKFNSDTRGFYFSHHSDKHQNIGEFLTKFEEIIGHNQNFSTFCQTSRSTILWVEPSRFWLDCQMKRSLLTILLRCGQNFNLNYDNFDSALFDETYYKENIWAKETRKAILRFLFGFTKFTGQYINVTETTTIIKHGWREEFATLSEKDIRQRLILPEGKNKEVNIVGAESLWN